MIDCIRLKSRAHDGVAHIEKKSFLEEKKSRNAKKRPGAKQKSLPQDEVQLQLSYFFSWESICEINDRIRLKSRAHVGMALILKKSRLEEKKSRNP